MTETEKKNMVAALTGLSASDAALSTYISLAGNRVLQRLYPLDPDKLDIPERYQPIQCELAARMLLKRGAEGESVHNENGVQRTYASADDKDILGKIVPMARVRR